MTLENWTYVVSLCGVASWVIRWCYRLARRVETIFSFVEKLESNHLNHIYERLGRIEAKLGIDGSKGVVGEEERENGRNQTGDS